MPEGQEKKGEVAFIFPGLTDERFHAVRSAGFAAMDAQRAGRELTEDEQLDFAAYCALERFLGEKNKDHDHPSAASILSSPRIQRP
jgi:hypothetical protein